MTAYRYRAIATSGSLVTGIIDLPNEADVVAHVRGLGHYPVSASVATANRLGSWLATLEKRDGISYRRLSVATQELATLLQAGLDLERALGFLEKLGDLGPLQKRFAAVRADVRDGASLADALAAERVFPRFFVNTIRAGELGGSLETTLQKLSQYLARTVAVRESIASALVYPVILLVTAGLSIVFILIFVLPEFQPLFQEAGRVLPWPTRIVMALGDFVRTFWWLIAITLFGSALIFRRLLRKPEFRQKLDRRLLGLPVLGTLLLAIDIERFSRTLGTLLANGVTLATALPLAKDVVANRVLAAAIADSASGLREGDAFADRLQQPGVFPEVTIDLIRVGEETGKLDEMLLRQADLDEQRIRHSVDRLLAIMVPALTILLGLMVGGLIASLLTAILGINDLALPR
jgi:general secretion pathway protein F